MALNLPETTNLLWRPGLAHFSNVYLIFNTWSRWSRFGHDYARIEIKCSTNRAAWNENTRGFSLLPRGKYLFWCCHAALTMHITACLTFEPRHTKATSYALAKVAVQKEHPWNTCAE